MKTVLTIAGSDSIGGAGMQADIKTFCAYGVYATCVVTAVTAQNTITVSRIQPVEPGMVTAQLEAVFSDIPPNAVKIGMLYSEQIIMEIANFLDDLPNLPPIVLDPVMLSTSGANLLEKTAVEALVDRLFPKATLVTPNLPEACAITGRSAGTRKANLLICNSLLSMGCKAVLLKGGHGEGKTVTDLLVSNGNTVVFSHERIRTKHTHGTGCTLSSAVAAGLALGYSLEKAVDKAIRYVTNCIKRAPGLGSGSGPLNHFVKPS